MNKESGLEREISDETKIGDLPRYPITIKFEEEGVKGRFTIKGKVGDWSPDNNFYYIDQNCRWGKIKGYATDTEVRGDETIGEFKKEMICFLKY